MKSLSEQIKARCTKESKDEMTLKQYLELCKEKGKEMYLSPAERLLKAIGDPVSVDTSLDPKLAPIFSARKINTYPAFSDFYGMETVIENLVQFLKAASQGLEERKQILYLLGPVGSAKSSLAERLKELMEKEPFYAIKDSPVFDSPLSLLTEEMAKEYSVPKRYLNIPSPWAVKRVSEMDDPLTEVKVVKLYPSKLNQVAIAKTEPGDENNQDVSSLVGKTKLSSLGTYDQHDPDCYEFSGALCRANRGLFEFVEMFKAPFKTLNPLLTATQERNYVGTETIGAIPFDGIALAHSNETEFTKFSTKKENEAFLDRICIIRVPYNTRVSKEIDICKKMLDESELSSKKLAPHTLECLSKLVILSRLIKPENSHVTLKMKVYDGETVKDGNNLAKTYAEYKEDLLASNNHMKEAMFGISTRDSFKILGKAINMADDYTGNPINLFMQIKKYITELPDRSVALAYEQFMSSCIEKEFFEDVQEDLHNAYLSSAEDFLQARFDNYISFADAWVQDRDFRDPDTGELYDRDALNDELESIEKAGKLTSNPKDFRHEVVNFVLRTRVSEGKVKWNAFKKIADVIKAQLGDDMARYIKVLDTGGKTSKEDNVKHDELLKNLMKQGYSKSSIPQVIKWYLTRRQKNG